ncbi:MAG: fimbrial protein pilA [bacterium]|nr:fimbrial protein pilA [bacterium]
MARRRNAAGFTLIELMIVVAIIAVLATIAGTAYRRYMDSGRTTEAMAMLGEIRAKEEAYRAEFSQYFGWSGGMESSTNALPQVDTAGCVGGGTKEPCYKAIPNPVSGGTAPWPSWGLLGLNAGRAALQCGYIVNFGAVGTTVPGTMPLEQNILTTATQTQPWWGAVAICDNDGSTTKNATFTTASTTTVVSAQNEHQ